jgi:hypothetical protein
MRERGVGQSEKNEKKGRGNTLFIFLSLTELKGGVRRKGVGKLTSTDVASSVKQFPLRGNGENPRGFKSHSVHQRP